HRLQGMEVSSAKGVQNPFTDDDAVQRTDPGSYFEWRVPVGRRVFAIWDMAGEDFEKVAEARLMTEDLRKFLCRVLPLCRGLILTIALPKLWDKWKDGTPRDADHQKLEENVNTYVRFLEFARVAQTLARKDRFAVADSSYLNDDRIRQVLKHAGPL